ncbi:TauD/TfdA dioxygenase family protein [Minwuia thermotolerans]|uniref:Taurine dioxygenase n=1 Tax=Minwuia thermotolerans TaxID=2056226 RepID=A0A2M9FYU1_9PROT|nr:TauD/TfdA family dioxygenase [Minwuia thermotolerans]PJK28627.1 taurine dioxygenase [Minwuia thermotolerans]
MIEIEPSGGGVGAFVRGVDLSSDVSGDVAGELRAALGDHGVLFFRDQKLAPEDHIAFAEKFGAINVNRFFAKNEDYPQIAMVAKEPEQTGNIGGSWHTDHSYDREPALGSILVAREVPAQGGDTLFANMYAAWEALSEGLKRTLEGLNAVHSSRHVFGAKSGYAPRQDGRIGNPDLATQDAVHPAVITHPISGRRALYVNGGFTIRFDGWTEEESRPLLQYLYAHAARPEFTYRFRWEDGSVAFWDNRATWHYAVNDYHGQRRVMHRITVEGCALS